jgi:hypothetical protein
MSRNYACVFTMSESLLGHYIALLDAFTKGEHFAQRFGDIHNVQKDYLELFVNRGGEFSRFLHDFPFGQEELRNIKNDFRVKGPFVLLFLTARDQD